jgi:hypothetical protein
MVIEANQIKRGYCGFIRSSFFIPSIYLLLAFLSYGLLINRMGFYWDDLPYLYLNHSQGIAGYPAYMSFDRPFSAWFFMLEGFLFGENPLGYHIFGLLLRWAGACVFFFVLEKTFIENKSLNFIAAAIFLVYPGFLQQPISLIYSLHFMVLLLFLLSILFMLIALEKSTKYHLFTFLSLVTSLSIFSSEYFAMLELIRPVLLWLFCRRFRSPSSKSINWIFRIWVPYLIVLIAFLTWRVIIFKFPTYSLQLFSTFGKEKLPELIHLVTRIIKDLFTVAIKVWLRIFNPDSIIQLNLLQILLWLSISIISSMIIFTVLAMISPDHHEKKLLSNKKMILGGMISIFLAGIPIWVTDLPIELDFAWNRLTLPFSLGIGLIMAGIFSLFLRKRIARLIFFSLLIGFSVGFHFINSSSFVEDWESLNQFFRQLSWRVPGLDKGTTILTDQFPLKYYSDNSLTAPLNWIYDENNRSLNLNYMFYFLDVRLGRRLPDLEKDLIIDQPYRSFSFIGSTNQLVVLQYNPPGCVHLIDDSSQFNTHNYSENFQKAITLSNLNLISTQPNSKNLPDFFISGLKQDWCYFFEKADLARQQSNWNEIKQLADMAFASNLKPSDPIENLPFIEAYGHEFEFESAIKLSRLTLDSSFELKPQMCNIWKEILKNIPFEKMSKSVTQFFYSELQCFL